jgi:parallel beta-helix repeat protein
MTQWRIALVAVTLLATAPVHAGTPVSGTLTENTVWVADGSPFVLSSGTFTVNAGVTLTIDPGVQIQLASNTLFMVRGSLYAIGTSNAPIVFFAPPGTTAAGAIAFLGADFTSLATAIIAHCRFEALFRSTAPAFNAQYADMTITDSSFLDFQSTGIRLTDTRLVCLNNTFDDTGEAINVVQCAGLLARNSIQRVNGNSDGIDVDLAWRGPGDSTLVIEWNNIQGGTFLNSDGIDFGTASNVVCRFNTVRDFADKGLSIGEASTVLIYNNFISGCDIGIAIKDSSRPTIMNCTVVNCNYGVRSFQKYSGGGGRGSVTNCILWNCSIPVSLENGSTTTFGNNDICSATVWPGPGNINSNPLFTDPAGGNYTLAPDSPCINAGANMPWMLTETDLAGNPRILGGTVDMGIYDQASRKPAITWLPIPTPQTSNVPFPVTLVALDGSGATTPDFTGTAALSGWRRMSTMSGGFTNVVIAEVNPGTPDAIEFVNLSTASVNVSGWQVYIYDDSWPTPLTAFTFPSGSVVPANGLFVLSEDGTAPGTYPRFFCGQNIWWTTATKAAVMLRTAGGQTADFMCANGAAASDITVPVPVTMADWEGSPATATASDLDTYQRTGTADHHNATDWTSATGSIGTINAGLASNGIVEYTAPCAIIPLQTPSFTNGTWTGLAVAFTVGSNTFLRASYPDSLSGHESNPFNVVPGPASFSGDGDALPDWWELIDFGDLQRDGTGDFDHDGANDEAEWVAGTCPTNMADVLAIRNLELTPEVQDTIGFTWNTVSGRVYTVMTTTDLLDPWTNVPDTVYIEAVGSGQPLTYTNAYPGEPLRFFRTRVENPDTL